METVLICSAERYIVSDAKVGEIKVGVTVHYLNEYSENSAHVVGSRPIKAAATNEVFETVRKGGAPATYRLDFRSRASDNSRATLTVVKAEFIRPAKVFVKS